MIFCNDRHPKYLHTYSDSKTPQKISSSSSSFWHHFYSECLRPIWSKLKFFLQFLNRSTQQSDIRYLEHYGEGSRVALNVHIYSRFIVHLATIYVSHSILKQPLRYLVFIIGIYIFREVHSIPLQTDLDPTIKTNTQESIQLQSVRAELVRIRGSILT